MIESIDLASVSLAQSFAGPFIDIFMVALTFIGNPVFWTGIAAVYYWRGREKDSFFIMSFVVVSSVVVGLVKGFVGRPRPETPRGISFYELEQASFPSGHATLMAAAYGHMSHFLSENKKIVLLALVFVVGFTRLYLGMHFLSDVIAGLLLGYFIGVINFRLLHYAHGKSKRLLGIYVLVPFALFVLFVSPILSAVVLGYYLGYILYHGKLKHPENSLVRCWKKISIGFLGLVALAAPVLVTALPLEYRVGSTFLGGLWITLLWPLLYDRLLNKNRAK